MMINLRMMRLAVERWVSGPATSPTPCGATPPQRGRDAHATGMVRRSLLATMLLAAFVGVGPLVTTQANAASGAVWSLSSDFAAAPNQANPNPDSFGNPAVWQFLNAGLDHNPAGYALLGEFIPNRFGYPGLQGWQGSIVSGGDLDKLPHVSKNTRTDNPSTEIGVDWPPGTMMVHPLPDRAVAVGWRSPVNGDVSVTGGVIDRSTPCGDGVSWSIDRGAVTLTGGAIPNGGAQTFDAGSAGAAALVNIKVRKGDVLYVHVGPGPNGDHTCDNTGLDINILLVR